MCWRKHLLGFLNSSLGSGHWLFRARVVGGGGAWVRHFGGLAFVLAFALSSALGVDGGIPTVLRLGLALSPPFPVAAACGLSRLETWKRW